MCVAIATGKNTVTSSCRGNLRGKSEHLINQSCYSIYDGICIACFLDYHPVYNC